MKLGDEVTMLDYAEVWVMRDNVAKLAGFPALICFSIGAYRLVVPGVRGPCISKTTCLSLTSLTSWARRERRERHNFAKDDASLASRFKSLSKMRVFGKTSKMRLILLKNTSKIASKIAQSLKDTHNGEIKYYIGAFDKYNYVGKDMTQHRESYRRRIARADSDVTRRCRRRRAWRSDAMT
ncbi:hypothetical protein B0H11DRAFT_1909970 [Mycena galericulata]|nr:hypothetical protein B0H11DRAFT_1909970 [Mycena galericulata]